MNDQNPYMEDDSDIFEDDDASGQDAKQYVIRGPNGEELPEEVQERLRKYIDLQSAEGALRNMPAELIAISRMLHFFGTYPLHVAEGPLLIAVAEVLDDLTEGKVKKSYDFHNARRELVYTHTLLRMINVLIEVTSVANDGTWHWGEVHMYLNSYAELVNFIKDRAASRYATLASELGKDVDQQLIDGGVMTERSTYDALALDFPPADKDVS